MCDYSILANEELCDGCRSRLKLIWLRFDSSTRGIRAFGFVPISDIKQQIQDMEGIPAELQRLTFLGQELENGRCLNSYGVRAGDTLELLLPCGSGAFSNFPSGSCNPPSTKQSLSDVLTS